MANDSCKIEDMDDDSFELDDDDPALQDFSDNADNSKIGPNEAEEEIEKEIKRAMQVLVEWNFDRDISSSTMDDAIKTEENVNEKSSEIKFKDGATVNNETRSTFEKRDTLLKDVDDEIKQEEYLKKE